MKTISNLLIVASIMFIWYAVFSHSRSADTTPVAWSLTIKTLAWMFGLSLFFRILSHRRRKSIQPSNDGIQIEVISRGSDDISASARQLEYIKALGGNPKKGMTMSEASAIIDELKIQREIHNREEAMRRRAAQT